MPDPKPDLITDVDIFMREWLRAFKPANNVDSKQAHALKILWMLERIEPGSLTVAMSICDLIEDAELENQHKVTSARRAWLREAVKKFTKTA